MTIEHMLVPVDFSEHADHILAYATALAGKLQTRITLLHVVETPVLAGGAHMGMAYDLVSYTEQLEAEAWQRIDAYAQRVRTAGLECLTVVNHAVPFQQIVDHASAAQVDLIVMGTHGHTGLQRFLLGSVAERVVRLAPCPVLVIHPQQAATEP